MKKNKLLILGGLAQMCDIIQDAIDAGHHVIVADNLIESPGKKIASEHHLISITDTEGLINLCRASGVNGVMSYCIHSGQKPYQKICEALGYPCYGTAQQFNILTNKKLFKEACRKSKMDVVPEITNQLNELVALPESDFPIVIKPVDGRASKGVSICYSKHELKGAIANAKKHSFNEEFLVEKYMNGCEIAVKYFVVNGEIYLTSMSDIYTLYHGRERIYIWSQVFPSKSYDLFLREADGKVRSFIKALGIRNGPLSFSGFLDGKKFRFIDPSFRLGGAQDWLIVKQITGINISKAMTRFALTGTMGESNEFTGLDNRINEKASAMLYFLVRPGVITEIHGLDAAKRNEAVVNFHQCHPLGHEVKHFGSTDHVALRFLLVTDEIRELKKSMYEIQKEIRIFDERGENMLLQNFDPELV